MPTACQMWMDWPFLFLCCARGTCTSASEFGFCAETETLLGSLIGGGLDWWVSEVCLKGMWLSESWISWCVSFCRLYSNCSAVAHMGTAAPQRWEFLLGCQPFKRLTSPWLSRTRVKILELPQTELHQQWLLSALASNFSEFFLGLSSCKRCSSSMLRTILKSFFPV